MLLRPSNLLLMDEPTNHLDLNSKEVLLDALRSFGGAVVFVSHDRYFIDHLATRVVEVEGGGVRSYPGDYEYYLARKKGEETGAVETIRRGETGKTEVSRGEACHAQYHPPTVPALLPPTPKEERFRRREEEKQSRMEAGIRAKRLAELEREIGKLEAELAGLEGEMAEPAFFADPERARQAGERHRHLTEQIAERYNQWESPHGG